MAGDWIKMRTDLYRDPKVCVIADILLDPNSPLARSTKRDIERDMSVTRNVTRNVTVGALVSVWGVLRHRGKRFGDDLIVPNCKVAIIDDLADIPGFGEAMAAVGWVTETTQGLVLPNFFDEYNVDPSDKKREKDAARQRRHRAAKATVTNGVTNGVTECVTVTTREEKRREYIKPPNPLSPDGEGGTSDVSGDPPKKVESEKNAEKVQVVLDYYRQYHPKAALQLTSKSPEYKKIADRLREGHSVEDLKLAIDGNHRSPHHCGKNDKKTEYHNLGLIFRDSSHVTMFIGHAGAPLKVYDDYQDFTKVNHTEQRGDGPDDLESDYSRSPPFGIAQKT